jgi:ribosome-associated toxin RatA of RatAB toxin-antitoxin module
MKAITLLVLLAVLLPAPAAGADAWQRALDRGEILVYTQQRANGAPEVVVKAVVEAAPRQVWQLVSDCGRYPRTMLRIKAARELRRRGAEVVCRVTVDMPFPYADLTATTRAIHRRSGPRFSRRWELLDGDYRVNRGSWVLGPFGGDPRRTLVVYRVQAVPKAWIPEWIRRKAQSRSLPEMIRRIRSLVRG